MTHRSSLGVLAVMWRRDAPHMPSITEVLRTLGHDGATANARRALHVRDEEAWLVTSLIHRLEARDMLATASAPGEFVSAATITSAA